MTYNTQIVALNPRHYKIMELCMLGWTQKAIADHLDMGQVQVSIVVNSPSFQHEYAIRRSDVNEKFNEQIVVNLDEVTQKLKEGAIKAATKLVDSMSSTNELIALKASDSILDRSGFPKMQKDIKTITSINISEEDSKRIVDALLLDRD